MDRNLDIYHGLLDGTGMYMVLSTLLYEYCSRRYGVTDHKGVRTLDYSDKIRNMPFDRQCTVYRGKTFIQSDSERVGGRIFLTVHQRFEEDIIIQSLLDELKRNGISYKVHKHIPADNAHFPLP